MNIYLDIETIPTQRRDVIEAIREEVVRELSAKAETIRQQYKKPETIEAHLGELSARQAYMLDDAYRRTALDGGFGEVLAIGWASDDDPVQSLCRKLDEPEADLLSKFADVLLGQNQTPLCTGSGTTSWASICGSCGSVIWSSGIQPAVPIDDREGLVSDTMLDWAGRFSRDRWPSLDQLPKQGIQDFLPQRKSQRQPGLGLRQGRTLRGDCCVLPARRRNNPNSMVSDEQTF